jgi:biotin carboxyl carrier protein
MHRVPAAALLLGLLLCAAASAHEEAAAPEVPLDIWLDKPAQHRAGIRTQAAAAAVAALRLPAVVVADPRRESRIAAVQDGVVAAAGGALPVAGQAVQAGQVLAWLRPLLSQPDRRDMGMDLALAQRDIKQDRIQIDRYGIDENQHLDVKLSTPSLDIITNYRSAQARDGELSGALRNAIAVIAPQAGTVLRSPAMAGKVAAAGEILFEIEAPGALAVEADYADDDIDAQNVQQALAADGRVLPLSFLGLSFDSALRTHRALYTAADPSLSVNQPLLLEAQRRYSGPAPFALPATAVCRDGGGPRVWLHLEAQHFRSRPVELLDRGMSGGADGEVLVAGLQPGERVVIAGTAALEAAAHGGGGVP